MSSDPFSCPNGIARAPTLQSTHTRPCVKSITKIWIMLNGIMYSSRIAPAARVSLCPAAQVARDRSTRWHFSAYHLLSTSLLAFFRNNLHDQLLWNNNITKNFARQTGYIDLLDRYSAIMSKSQMAAKVPILSRYTFSLLTMCMYRNSYFQEILGWNLLEKQACFTAPPGVVSEHGRCDAITGALTYDVVLDF
jgi:hypothetical protein